MQASFIAKPLLECAGNGLHMHISVVDDKGKNIFAGANGAHQRLHHAIGGLLATMPAAMSFWAPNINSWHFVFRWPRKAPGAWKIAFPALTPILTLRWR